MTDGMIRPCFTCRSGMPSARILPDGIPASQGERGWVTCRMRPFGYHGITQRRKGPVAHCQAQHFPQLPVIKDTKVLKRDGLPRSFLLLGHGSERARSGGRRECVAGLIPPASSSYPHSSTSASYPSSRVHGHTRKKHICHLV